MKDKSSLLAEMYQQLKQELLQGVQPFTPEKMPEETLEDLERREADFKAWQQRDAWRRKKFLYDLWTAAFVLRRFYRKEKRYNGCEVKVGQPFGITWGTMLDYAHGQPLPEGLTETVEKMARDYQFFHAEVSFPDVTARGGFDVILANPPWERIKLQEKEWFTAHRQTEIAEASNAAERKRMIEKLAQTDPLIYTEWHAALRKVDGMSHFLRSSGRYPLCGQGDINLYAVFAEAMRRAVNDGGRLGCVVPSGIATDNTTSLFFRDMVETKSLISLYDFENKGIFPEVHNSYKFCLLTTGSGRKPMAERAHFVFFAHSTDEIDDPDKNFSLSPQDIALLNPNTHTCPVFRNTKDEVLTRAVYRRVPVLIREAQGGKAEVNPWELRFGRMFDMSNDSHLFRTRDELEKAGWELSGNIFYPTKDVKSENNEHRFLPLYEAKMIHQFNHRWATYNGMKIRDAEPKELASKNFSVIPRYWVSEADVEENLKAMKWKHPWLAGWRDICRATDERTVISTIWPNTAAGDTCLQMFSDNKLLFCLPACLNSFPADYITRQKIGGTHLKYHYFRQIAVLPPSTYTQPTPWDSKITITEWIHARILELLYTAEDMRPFAHEMGYDGEPFPWDEKRRFALRAELDAAFFHLYLPAEPDGRWRKAVNESETDYRELTAVFPTPRHAVDYIMETFPIKKKNDLKAFTSYRTKEVILQDYDAMLAAIRSGKDWKSPLF